MTVNELIKALSEMPQGAEIFTTSVNDLGEEILVVPNKPEQIWDDNNENFVVAI